jgi:hypothetical protein
MQSQQDQIQSITSTLQSLFILTGFVSIRMSVSTSSTDIEQKAMAKDTVTYTPSIEDGEVSTKWEDRLQGLKKTFLTKEGWIGDYVRCLPHWNILKTNIQSRITSIS